MGHSGDGCDLASALCKYDLRKGDLFVLSMLLIVLLCCRYTSHTKNKYTHLL